MTLQYYKPAGNLNIGDCMPFFHDGVFRLFYLIDVDHHQALGGLGGHQWAQATSTDLVHWEHLPMAIPITEDREGSICTGSVFFQGDTYYAFYATRMRDHTQHLSLAVSDDGAHFRKTEPNPFASPLPGYNPLHYRDPVVFRDEDDGRFHMLVTASLETWPVPERGGCLAHLVSKDLSHWDLLDPFLVPGLPGAPECPDYFFWRGWYYLVFSNGGMARYRMSRELSGPWLRPRVDTLGAPAARVMKTAPFVGDRRIGVAWIGTRRDDKDDGPFQFGGNALFRELIQHEDGTLGACFPPEMLPTGREWAGCAITPWLGEATVGAHSVRLGNGQGLAVARGKVAPRDMHLSLQVVPEPGVASFGLRLSAVDGFESGYELRFSPVEGIVQLAGQTLTTVTGLAKPFALEIVMQGDLVDVCIAGCRTIVDRWPERTGNELWFFALDGEVVFEGLSIEDLS